MRQFNCPTICSSPPRVRDIVGLYVDPPAHAINRFVAETNDAPKPFTCTADPAEIIAAVTRGRQTLDSIHLRQTWGVLAAVLNFPLRRSKYAAANWGADMFARKLFYSLSLGLVLALLAVVADYFASNLRGDPHTPVSTFCIAFTISVVVSYYFISQRMALAKAHDRLLQAQAAKNALVVKLEIAMVETEAANAAKSDFLATMSHEIRTPLNGVLGMAQAMDFDELSTRQRDRLHIIRESGDALLAILNDILDLSKIEAGKLKVEEIEFDFGALCAGVSAAFTQLANKKGISFAVDIAGAAGLYRGDPTRIRQVLYNLVSNALKFTEVGEIRITADRAPNLLTIIVQDSGIGMSEAVLSALFSRYTQAEASTTRRFGGTGLGLSICRQLVELMGGDVLVASAEGRGSRFEVNLPLAYLGPRREAPLGSVVEADGSDPRTLRVLAAEDNPTNQLVLRTLLHQLGINPKLVGNGVEAVEAWRHEPFDVILMDVQMPEMDGPTATREIRRLESDSGQRRTPVIALTANAMAHQVREYEAAGMDGFVAKPIEIRKLYEVLAALPEAEHAVAEAAA